MSDKLPAEKPAKQPRKPRRVQQSTRVRANGQVQQYSDSIKAEVIGCLMAGMGCTEVAEKFGLNKQVVSKWWVKLDPEMIEAVDQRRREMLAGEMFETARSVLRSFRAATALLEDDAYLKKYSPRHAAVLLGVTFDKGAHLLGLLARFNLLGASSAGAGEGDSEPEVRPALEAPPTIRVEYFDDDTSTAAALESEED